MKKLQNRETGEIGNLVLNINPNRESYCVLSTENGDTICGNLVIADYDTLDELNAEWKDYKETVLDEMIEKLKSDFEKYPDEWNNLEDAKKIVKRLEAFTKLKKEKGFRFTGWAMLDSNMIAIYAKRKFESIKSDEELDLLFGGEE